MELFPMPFSSRLSTFLLIISLALTLSLHCTAGGAKPEEEKVVLTLSQLIEMAISRSPDIRGVESEIASAKSDLAQARAAYYPQIETTAVVGPVEDAKEPLVANGRILDPSPSLGLSSIGIFGRINLIATQPIYTFGKISNREDAASRGIKAREFQMDEQKARIVLRVKELYYALILARSGMETADEARDFFDEAGRRISRLLKLGSPNVKETDLYKVDSYRADSLRFKAEAEKGFRISYFVMKSLIQLPPDVEFELAEKALPTRMEEPAALDKYIETASSERPEFKQLAEALAAQDYRIKAAVSDMYPSFFAAVQGSLAGAPGREVLHNRYIPDDFNHAYAGVVAGAKWSLDFGIGKARVDKMRAEYNKLLNTRASAKMNIPIQVAQSYQEHLEARKAAASYQTAAIASRKWVVTAMADFDMGVETADEMLRAIEKYGQNQSKYIEALFNYNLSRARLEYAAGMKTW
ncbi:MAG: TolC family protein [Syntrophales bacterium]